MDGILDELLRLENAKHRALIAIDSAGYDDAVQQQTRLVGDPQFAAAAAAPYGSGTLLAFSNLAYLNTTLYENLIASFPWLAVSSRRGYTGQGYVADSDASGGFSVEG